MTYYDTLAQLKAAYDSGELDKKECPLLMDSDCSVVLDEEGEEIYRGLGRDQIWEEALPLLGIEWRQV